MKKGTLLNAPLSHLIATLGHTQSMAIADAGLPIPPDVDRIDLALRVGIPSFLETLQVTVSEMQVETAIFASEIFDHNESIYNSAVAILQDANPDITITTTPHENFKDQTEHCTAIVRTGECSPYANVILISGVVF